MEAENSEIARRRYSDVLYISGGGVMVMGIWNMLQIIILLTFRRDELISNIGEYEDPEFVLLSASIGLIFIALIDMFVRVYVGMSARAEAMEYNKIKKKKRRGYLFLAVLVLMVSIFLMVLEALSYDYYGLFQYIIRLIINLTSTAMSFDLVYAAIKIKRE